MLNITASIYANENGFDNCLLLNDSKNVVEAIKEIFYANGTDYATSIRRLFKWRKKTNFGNSQKLNPEVVEEVISPFDLQKADELFITNVIKESTITKYGKRL
jgi:branched-chain amino acid aminotransferase